MRAKTTFTPRRYHRSIWNLGDYDVSRDGRFLAHSTNKGDQYAVFVRDLRTGREWPAAKGEQALMCPECSPDGRFIAMQADFHGDENSNILVAPTRGGASRRLTDHPMDHAHPRWSPDGARIAFISNRDRDRENVFVVDAAGGDPVQLTRFDEIVSAIAWRPDGSGLAFSVGSGDRDRIGFVDLAGRTETLVARPDSENVIAGDGGKAHPWSPDGRRLAFITNAQDSLDVAVLDLETREVRTLVRNDRDHGEPQWSPDGRAIAFLENRDGNVRLHTVRAEGGRPRAVSPAAGVAARVRWHPDSRGLWYQHSTAARPDRLALQRGARATAVVDSVRRTLPSRELVKGRVVRYTTFDGRTVSAWLFRPPKGRDRRAALVIPHGGPEWQSENHWDIGDLGAQYFVAAGYTVLFPNFRGGTGYGRAWRRLSDRDLGGGDMKDVIAGARWLLEKGLAEPGRLGVVGLSYGGYAVAHCLQQAPDLWAVGVSIVGFFDWATAATNERGYLALYDRWKMGSYETDREHFRRYSPYTYLDRIRAPVLFFGGANDPRCPVVDIRQMVEGMRKAGKVIDYVEFPDEGHVPRKMKNQILLYERTLEWLDRHLAAKA